MEKLCVRFVAFMTASYPCILFCGTRRRVGCSTVTSTSSPGRSVSFERRGNERQLYIAQDVPCGYELNTNHYKTVKQNHFILFRNDEYKFRSKKTPSSGQHYKSYKIIYVSTFCAVRCLIIIICFYLLFSNY